MCEQPWFFSMNMPHAGHFLPILAIRAVLSASSCAVALAHMRRGRGRDVAAREAAAAAALKTLGHAADALQIDLDCPAGDSDSGSGSSGDDGSHHGELIVSAPRRTTRASVLGAAQRAS